MQSELLLQEIEQNRVTFGLTPIACYLGISAAASKERAAIGNAQPKKFVFSKQPILLRSVVAMASAE